jgi:hypothetical protein
LLGLAHNSGNGVPQDYIQAYAWLKEAVAQGLEVAKEYCEETKTKMTPSQIEEGQRLSREYAEKFRIKQKPQEKAQEKLHDIAPKESAGYVPEVQEFFKGSFSGHSKEWKDNVAKKMIEKTKEQQRP